MQYDSTDRNIKSTIFSPVIALMNAFIEAQSRSSIFSHQLSALFKKEVEGERKIKIANELSELKN